MWRQFRRHRLAMVGAVVLIIFYLVALAAAGFVATQNPGTRNARYAYAPPQLPRFVDSEGKFHKAICVWANTDHRPDTWEKYIP